MNNIPRVGLFPISYEIGGALPGAPLFTMHLGVFTPGETVSGMGHVTQAISPPLDVGTALHGTFTYMTVMPKNTHILVTMTGYPITGVTTGREHGPNVKLRMVLNDDWEAGTANYKYLDHAGEWREVKDAAVKATHGEAAAL